VSFIREGGILLERARGLSRFVEAQDDFGYDKIVRELARGQKQSHWIWFVFPQTKGLGKSTTSRVYALSDWEAKRYAKHSVLGPRLRECTFHVRWWTGSYAAFMQRSLEDVFGELDAMKFRSSMELFYRVTGERIFDLEEGHD
jgi:uncharacterized protein (DUF1810 family)